MQKQTMNDMNAGRLADAALAASRQVWSQASGAAAVTRQWAKERGGQHASRTDQGRLGRRDGKRSAFWAAGSKASLATASSIWTRTREQVRATVTALADTAVAALPKLKAPAKMTRRTPVAKPRKAVKARTSKRVKHAVRRVKSTSRKAK